MDATTSPPRTALVTGASGYIGRRLVPRLLQAGWSVRVLTRSLPRLATAEWVGDVDLVVGDARDPAVMHAALDGVDVAFFLMHAMADGRGFERREAIAARVFARAAANCSVVRTVYLGALGPDSGGSPHLRSRRAVERILLAGQVPVTVLRASVILGEDSTAVQLMDHALRRLPVIARTSWSTRQVQPLALEDALHFLLVAADDRAGVSRVLDLPRPLHGLVPLELAIRKNASPLRTRAITCSTRTVGSRSSTSAA